MSRTLRNAATTQQLLISRLDEHYTPLLDFFDAVGTERRAHFVVDVVRKDAEAPASIESRVRAGTSSEIENTTALRRQPQHGFAKCRPGVPIGGPDRNCTRVRLTCDDWLL